MFHKDFFKRPKIYPPSRKSVKKNHKCTIEDQVRVVNEPVSNSEDKTYTNTNLTISECRYIYLGIDPGKSGGFAYQYRGTITASKMPDSMLEFRDSLQKLLDISNTKIICWLEHVWGYLPVKGIARDLKTGGNSNAMRMFEFGRNYGSIETVLNLMGITYQTIRPHLWQRALGLPRVADKGDRKRCWRDKANKLFPGINATLATADAILLSEFAKRTHRI